MPENKQEKDIIEEITEMVQDEVEKHLTPVDFTETNERLDKLIEVVTEKKDDDVSINLKIT